MKLEGPSKAGQHDLDDPEGFSVVFFFLFQLLFLFPANLHRKFAVLPPSRSPERGPCIEINKRDNQFVGRKQGQNTKEGTLGIKKTTAPAARRKNRTTGMRRGAGGAPLDEMWIVLTAKSLSWGVYSLQSITR